MYGRRLPAVEDVVGADVDELRPGLLRRVGDVPRAGGVDREGRRRVLLALVEVVEGRGVDDEVGRSLAHDSRDRVRVHDVDIRVAQARDLGADSLEGVDDVAAELAGGPQDEDAFGADG